MASRERELFEEWAKREHPDDINLYRWCWPGDEEEYRHEGAAVGWLAWQAAAADMAEQCAVACEQGGDVEPANRWEVGFIGALRVCAAACRALKP